MLTKLSPLRYFAGSNGIEVIKFASASRHQPVFNYFIEAVPEITPIQMVKKYNELIREVKHFDNTHKPVILNKQNRVSIKLSNFNFNKDCIDNTVKQFILNNWQIIIEAENVNNHSLYNVLTQYLISTYNIGKPYIIKTYQMNRVDGLAELQKDLDYYKSSQNKDDDNSKKIHIGVKLSRGSYWKQDKHTGKLFTTKIMTDSSFNKALDILHNLNNENGINIIATHNKATMSYLNIITNNDRHNFEYAYILGMHSKDDVDNIINYNVKKKCISTIW